MNISRHFPDHNHWHLAMFERWKVRTWSHFCCSSRLGLSKGAHPNGRENESSRIFRTFFESFSSFSHFVGHFFRLCRNGSGLRRSGFIMDSGRWPKLSPKLGTTKWFLQVKTLLGNEELGTGHVMTCPNMKTSWYRKLHEMNTWLLSFVGTVLTEQRRFHWLLYIMLHIFLRIEHSQSLRCRFNTMIWICMY